MIPSFPISIKFFSLFGRFRVYRSIFVEGFHPHLAHSLQRLPLRADWELPVAHQSSDNGNAMVGKSSVSANLPSLGLAAVGSSGPNLPLGFKFLFLLCFHVLKF